MGVLQQIAHHLLHAERVGVDAYPAGDGYRGFSSAPRREDVVAHLMHQGREVDLGQLEGHTPRLQAGDHQQILHQLGQMLGLAGDDPQELVDLLAWQVLPAVAQGVGEPGDGGERRAQLVADHRNELVLDLPSPLRRAHGSLLPGSCPKHRAPGPGDGHQRNHPQGDRCDE